MSNILPILSIVLLLSILLLLLFRNSQSNILNLIQSQLAGLQTTIDKLSTGLKRRF
ncbi:MAG: hypothetical protein IPF62_11220 [Bacteroidetes bacterium]|nr:hypothetical protein [Bacteroidota bacterium]